jgi:IclR family acetate operon transcriptional repressor
MLGIGRAILANMPAPEVTSWLASLDPSHLPARFPTSSALLTELEQIRHTGYAINEGDYDPEVAAVAAPVFDRRANVIGAIAVDFPARDATDESYLRLGPPVMEAAANVRRILATLQA